jgi:hypothetical protein
MNRPFDIFKAFFDVRLWFVIVWSFIKLLILLLFLLYFYFYPNYFYYSAYMFTIDAAFYMALTNKWEVVCLIEIEIQIKLSWVGSPTPYRSI